MDRQPGVRSCRIDFGQEGRVDHDGRVYDFDEMFEHARDDHDIRAGGLHLDELVVRHVEVELVFDAAFASERGREQRVVGALSEHVAARSRDLVLCSGGSFSAGRVLVYFGCRSEIFLIAKVEDGVDGAYAEDDLVRLEGRRVWQELDFVADTKVRLVKGRLRERTVRADHVSGVRD